MKITEKREVTKKVIEDVLLGRKCDICGKQIEKIQSGFYNYFVIHTWHHDWGNDSCESHEYKDACSPECVMNFTQTYISDAYVRPFNTHEI